MTALANAPEIWRGPQRTPEWFRRKRGIPTASNFDNVVSETTDRKTKERVLGLMEGKTPRTYQCLLIAQRLLDEDIEFRDLSRFGAVQYGNQWEDTAILAFQEKMKVEVERVGFVRRGRIGCSPDGLIVGKNEIIEVKCPEPWTQVANRLDGMGEKYKPQVQGQLLVTGCDVAHFWSWRHDLPPVYVRTERDDTYIDTLGHVLETFCDDLDADTEKARVEFGLGPLTWKMVA